MAELQTVRKRNGSTHDKSGCLTCRARRKKCRIKTHPICGACKRLGLECHWKPVNRLSQPSLSRLQDLQCNAAAPNAPENLALQRYEPVTTIVSDNRSSKTRFFMKYYVDILAPMLTASHKHNSFLSAFVPMALESPVLLHALVAFSSAHLSMFDSQYDVFALETRSTALSSLLSSIHENGNQTHETHLAACLILSTSDICFGDREGWRHHLQGAGQLILSASAPGGDRQSIAGTRAVKQTSDGPWLLRNFAFHDIMGSIVSGQPLLIDASYLLDFVDSVDSYFGIAINVLVDVARISALRCIHEPGPPAGGRMDNTITPHAVSAIERRLLAWHCPDSTEHTLIDMANAYRSAALLYLYLKIRDCHWSNSVDALLDPCECPVGAVTDHKIEREVRRALDHISKIPLNGCPEATLLFPLFMVGVTTSTESDIPTVRSRMQHILSHRGFQNIRSALRALETVWTFRAFSHGQPQRDINWSQILKIVGTGLSLS